MRHVALALLALLATASADAQDFTVTYSFTGAAGNEATLPADNGPSGTTPSPISRGPGLSTASAAGAFSSASYTPGGTLTDALTAGDYFEFTLAPETGFALSLTSLQFSTQRSATGPQSGELRSSVDGFQSPIGSPVSHPTALAPVEPFDLSSAAFQNLTGPITFRLYSHSASSAAGTLRIDNIALTGTAIVGGAGQSVTVSLAEASAQLNEGQTTDTPTVTITTNDGAPLEAQATVQIQYVAAGSTGQAADVAGLPLVVTIPAGTVSGAAVTQPLTAVSDGLVEGTEIVRLVLGSARGASISAQSGIVTMTISDPAGVQAVTVSVDAPTSATVEEGASVTATFRVTTSDGAPVSGERTVALRLQDGEGLAANDFVGFTNPATLTVASGAASGSTVTLLLQTHDDSEYEGTETFTFRLGSPSANTAVGTPASFSITVTDNDALPQVVVCPGLTGAPLLACVRQSYTPANVYSYNTARDTLFAYAHDGDRTRITDVYVGRVVAIPPGADPTTAGCNGDQDNNSSSCSNSRTINTEHAWPQSYGASEAPAQGDMHHLYPARGDVNSVRNNNPYGEFSYRTAASLYRDTLTFTPATVSDMADSLSYSAYRTGVFMPRASVRGNLARSVFYFRTIYEAQAQAAGGIAFFEGMKATLMKWDKDDPVVGEELLRSGRVKRYQGNDNPFVLDSTLARRAFGPTSTGIEEAIAIAAELRVYPNPARTTATATGFNGAATVVDVLGRHIATVRAGDRLDVHTWPRGLYVLRSARQSVVFMVME